MKQYGILAHPAGHSLSPVMHNAAFKALGIEAQYGVFDVDLPSLPSFMERVANEPIHGLSVSLPYKQDVMQFLGDIDPDAMRIGAVNTVVNGGGFLHGYNTDFAGAMDALKEEYGELNGKVAVVLGAGGAARAIAYGLLKEGCHVLVRNRNKAKADQIAIEFAEMFDSEIKSEFLDHWYTGDILIHATSVWTVSGVDGELPEFCDEEYVDEFDCVMDIAYKPLETPLIEIARKLGKKVVTGEKMLLLQAVEQFKLWTGQEAPVDTMREALMRAL